LTLTVNDDVPATPAAAPDLTASEDSGSSNTDNETNDGSPAISGTGALALGRVNIYVGGAYKGYAIADGAGAWTYGDLAFDDADADYSVTARHVSAAGAESLDSPALVIKFDDFAPTILTAPALHTDSDGGDKDGIKTNDTTPKLEGTNEPYVVISVYHGTTLLGTATADASGYWSFQVTTAMGTGLQTFSYYATDVAGNTSGISGILQLDIDTSAPSASGAPYLHAADDISDNGFGASSTDTITNKQTGLSLSGSSTEYGIDVELYADNVLVGSTTTDGQGNWTIHLAGTVTPDLYDMVAYLIDEHGNKSAASGTTILEVDIAAPDAPGIPTVTATTTNQTKPTLTVTSAPGAVRVNFYHDGSLIGYAGADGNGHFILSQAGYPSYVAFDEGTHGVTARSVDAAGNESGDSAELTLTVITTPNVPTPTLVSDLGPDTDDNITSDGTPTFGGSGMSPGSTVTVYFDGDTIGDPVTADGSGNWSYTPEIGGPTHTIQIQGTDSVGNSGTSGILSITYDSANPSVDLVPEIQAVDEPITLTFTEAMYWDGTGNITLERGSDAPISLSLGDVAFSADKMTLTITPASNLIGDSSYTVRFPSSFTDLAGNSLYPITSPFETEDNVAPALSNFTYDGSTSLTLYFNETVSFGAGSILIRRASDNTVLRTIGVGDDSYWDSYDDDTVIVYVSGLPSGDYYVEIQNSLADGAGNFVSITGQADITFTRPIA
jgi:hypothetical protein